LVRGQAQKQNSLGVRGQEEGGQQKKKKKMRTGEEGKGKLTLFKPQKEGHKRPSNGGHPQKKVTKKKTRGSEGGGPRQGFAGQNITGEGRNKKNRGSKKSQNLPGRKKKTPKAKPTKIHKGQGIVKKKEQRYGKPLGTGH